MRYREEYFVYTTEWSSLLSAVGASVVMPISFSTEADFKAYLMTVAVKQGAAGAEVLVSTFGGTLQMKDQEVGRDLYSNPIPIDAVAGTGRQPYTFTPPRVFNRGTILLLTVTSNVATNTFVAISLHGAFLYPAGM